MEDTGKSDKQTEMTQPVIIDLGKQKRKDISDLKRGEGKLWEELFDVVDEVKEMLGKDAKGKVLIPVVMLYMERRYRRIGLERILFPLIEEDEDDDDEEDDDLD